MNRMQSGGGLPDMSELMSDPTLRNLSVIISVAFLVLRTTDLTVERHNSVEVQVQEGAHRNDTITLSTMVWNYIRRYLFRSSLVKRAIYYRNTVL